MGFQKWGSILHSGACRMPILYAYTVHCWLVEWFLFDACFYCFDAGDSLRKGSKTLGCRWEKTYSNFLPGF